MRGEASAAESSDCSPAFAARRLVRSCVALSRLRLSRSTARLTKTTPASRTALTAIETIAAGERARRRARLLGAGRGSARGRERPGAGTATAGAALDSAKLHRHAEARRLRPGVSGDLGSRRTDRATRRRAQRRARAAGADGELGRTRAAVLFGAEKALYDAVLERVEGDHREPSARPQHLERRRQRTLERAELVVDLDPQRLEDPLRGMALAESRRRRNRLLDDLDEVARPLERLLAASLDDRARDLARVALFAVTAEDLPAVSFGGVVHDVARGQLGRRIHAHVECGIGGLRKNALPPGELHRRDAQGEGDRIGLDAPRRQLVEYL